MSAPLASAHSAARPARTSPPGQRLTMGKRIALGFLHTGALFREATGSWRCRAFPQERVLDGTARALERDGLARLNEYEGLHGIRRACLSLTPAGIALYAAIGGQHAARRPPPAQAEGILRETEIAIDEMAEQEARLRKALAAIDAETRATRAAAKRIEARIAAIEARAMRFERERAQLASCRMNLRAFTDQTCERLGASLASLPFGERA